MEFLLDNPLAAMEGIYFLLLYVCSITVSLVALGFLKQSLDKTDGLAPPAIPPKLDPFEPAYLRGGPNELARMVIFSLRQKGLVEITKIGKASFVSAGSTVDSPELTEMERTALEWIGSGRPVKEIFSGSRSLVTAIDRWATTYQLDLEQRQLLIPEGGASRLLKWKWSIAAFIATVGGYKVLVGLATGNTNVIFTILLLLGGVTAAILIGRHPRRSSLGNRYLERLRLVFDSLGTEADDEKRLSSGEQRPLMLASVDPILLSVGVFGTATVAASLYPDYNDAFRRQNQDSSYAAGGCGGGGCGSSCSGGGGSCGGGGGCGGGGCGGCGG